MKLKVGIVAIGFVLSLHSYGYTSCGDSGFTTMCLRPDQVVLGEEEKDHYFRLQVGNWKSRVICDSELGYENVRLEDDVLRSMFTFNLIQTGKNEMKLLQCSDSNCTTQKESANLVFFLQPGSFEKNLNISPQNFHYAIDKSFGLCSTPELTSVFKFNKKGHRHDQ